MNGGAPDYEPYEEALPGGGTRVRWRRRDQTAVTPIPGNGQVPATREPAAGPDWYFPKGYARRSAAPDSQRARLDGRRDPGVLPGGAGSAAHRQRGLDQWPAIAVPTAGVPDSGLSCSFGGPVGVTGIDGRLSRLSSALTAKERALLVLRSWKEGKEEDPAWRYRMPDEQVLEFNRYIRLMNGVNRNLGPLLLHVEATVEMLSLRLGWLTTFMFWQWNTAQLVEYIERETTEPVTESEYRELEQKAREEYKPAAELAELLVERHEGWTEEDLAPDQGDDPHDDVIVSPKSWARVQQEKKREIAALVRKGRFHGNGEVACEHDSIAPLYNRLGIGLFVADYRGYGRSDGMPTFSSMAAGAHPILRFFLETAHSSGSSESLFVMGRSLGSHSAVELASQYPDQLSGLIVESGAPNAARMARRFGLASERIDELAEALSARIRSIMLPALIIHGDRDSLIPIEAGIALHQEIGSEKKRLVIIPGADHNDIMAVGAEQYFSEIKDFVFG